MAEHSRYSVSEKATGLKGGLLKNKLGLKDQQSIDDAETLLLSDAYEHFFLRLERDGLIFSVDLLLELHKYFLETLYSWAGKLRKVNISKGDTLFGSPEHLHVSLEHLNNELASLIPVTGDRKKEVAQKLAIIHNELNAIHPFREGNGRTLRLFLDLIAVNVGYAPINWQKIDSEQYFNACKLGMVRDHEPLAKLFYQGLRKM